VTSSPDGARAWCIAPHCGIANRVEAHFDDVVGVFTHSSWLTVRVAGANSFDDPVDRAADRLSLQSVPATVLNGALDGLPPAPTEDVELPVARAEQCWALSPSPDGGLTLQVEYSTDLFDADTAQEWQRRYLDLLERSVAAPHTKTWHH
jgi:iturin family lipopeptide synthetase A